MKWFNKMPTHKYLYLLRPALKFTGFFEVFDLVKFSLETIFLDQQALE